MAHTFCKYSCLVWQGSMAQNSRWAVEGSDLILSWHNSLPFSAASLTPALPSSWAGGRQAGSLWEQYWPDSDNNVAGQGGDVRQLLSAGDTSKNTFLKREVPPFSLQWAEQVLLQSDAEEDCHQSFVIPSGFPLINRFSTVSS